MQRRDFLQGLIRSIAVLAAHHWVGPLSPIDAASSRLLYHFEDWPGEHISARQSERLANPASVTKMATTLMALHHYTPSFRYLTTFAPSGSIDPKTRTLKGDLHVYASGDPDFHDENALLVAASLNRLGVDQVTGNLIIHGPFHISWSDGRVPTSQAGWRRYVIRKGALLRKAWDRSQWTESVEQAWEELDQQLLAEQRQDALAGFCGLNIQGEIRAAAAKKMPDLNLAVIHHSNPLLRMLKRFNSYSNNDIERIGEQLGGPRALKQFLTKRMGLPAKKVRFSSTSGLGRNRLSPRAAVQVVRGLMELGNKNDFELTDVLPVAGVDEGTLLERFTEPAYAGSVVAKSGQLVRTDRGVQTLSGVAYTQQGPLLFAIFHVRTGRRVEAAKDRLDETLLRFIDRRGGPSPLEYNPVSFPLAYDQVQIEVVRGT